MWLDLVVGGIYLPAFLVFLAAAAGLYLLLQILLRPVQVERLFWHPALAGAAVFIAILAMIILWVVP